MRNSIKQYTINLTTMSPLFIGDGSNITKKEYVHDKRNNRVLVFYLEKMYRDLVKMGLGDQYERFMLGSPKNRLNSWFYDMNIKYETYRKWAEYELDASEVVIERDTKDLNRFIRDPYHQPYIPGSSLKGALRTVLLAKELMEMDKCELTEKRKSVLHGLQERKWAKQVLDKEKRQIEIDVFHTKNYLPEKRFNAVNDLMSGLRIGDSVPLDQQNLTLCQKIDITPDGCENRLPILRECIKPGTVITFPMTLDREFPYAIEDLEDAVNLFYDPYSLFLEAFQRANWNQNNILYLGGGAGFVSKTLVYPMFDDKQQRLKVMMDIFDQTLSYKARKEHKHREDIQKGVSPHMIKCTRYGNKLYEMGKCKIEFLE